MLWCIGISLIFQKHSNPAPVTWLNPKNGQKWRLGRQGGALYMRQLFFYLQQLPVEICCGNMNCRMCSERSVDKVKSSVGGGARSPGAGLSAQQFLVVMPRWWHLGLHSICPIINVYRFIHIYVYVCTHIYMFISIYLYTITLKHCIHEQYSLSIAHR